MTQEISFDCTRATTTRVHTIFVDNDILIKVHYKRKRKIKKIRAKMELITFLQNGLYKMQINLME